VINLKIPLLLFCYFELFLARLIPQELNISPFALLPNSGIYAEVFEGLMAASGLPSFG
jgi:hypothetical protein